MTADTSSNYRYHCLSDDPETSHSSCNPEKASVLSGILRIFKNPPTEKGVMKLIRDNHQDIVHLFLQEASDTTRSKLVYQEDCFRVLNFDFSSFWYIPCKFLLMQKSKQFILVSPLNFRQAIIFKSNSKYKISPNWFLRYQQDRLGVSLGIQFLRGGEECLIHGRNRATLCDKLKVKLHYLKTATLPSFQKGSMDEYHQIEYLSNNHNQIEFDPSKDGREGTLYTIITMGTNVYNMTAQPYALGDELPLKNASKASKLKVHFYWFSEWKGTMLMSQTCPLLSTRQFDTQFNKRMLWRGADGHLATERPQQSQHNPEEAPVSTQSSRTSSFHLSMAFLSLRGSSVGEGTTQLRYAILRHVLSSSAASLCMITDIEVSMTNLLRKLFPSGGWDGRSSLQIGSSPRARAGILFNKEEFKSLESFSSEWTIIVVMLHKPSKTKFIAVSHRELYRGSCDTKQHLLDIITHIKKNDLDKLPVIFGGTSRTSKKDLQECFSQNTQLILLSLHSRHGDHMAYSEDIEVEESKCLQIFEEKERAITVQTKQGTLNQCRGSALVPEYMNKDIRDSIDSLIERCLVSDATFTPGAVLQHEPLFARCRLKEMQNNVQKEMPKSLQNCDS